MDKQEKTTRHNSDGKILDPRKLAANKQSEISDSPNQNRQRFVYTIIIQFHYFCHLINLIAKFIKIKIKFRIKNNKV
jgi:hypothetical protein